MNNSTLKQPLFSPEGRLYEVEYAMEAVAYAGASVAVLTTDSIVVVAEIENRNPLVDTSLQPGRIFMVDKDNACIIAGNAPDGYRLTKAMTNYSNQYQRYYGEMMPVQKLVEKICYKKQSYTMFSNKRPFGISVIYFGWDALRGYQIYESDPSGNYSGWRSICIGRNAHLAQQKLNHQLAGKPLPHEGMGMAMALRAIDVATEPLPLSGSSIQVGIMRRNGNTTKLELFDRNTIHGLCSIHYRTDESSGHSLLKQSYI